MSCFSCLIPRRRKEVSKIEDSTGIRSSSRYSSENDKKKEIVNKEKERNSSKRGARGFTFRELATATTNFKVTNLIGEGGFGRVHKGRLETDQIVAIKKLDQNGIQGNQEFIVEVLMLSLLHHSNLVRLIGYCADGDQRILVYEYMPMGSLEDHLFGMKCPCSIHQCQKTDDAQYNEALPNTSMSQPESRPTSPELFLLIIES